MTAALHEPLDTAATADVSRRKVSKATSWAKTGWEATTRKHMDISFVTPWKRRMNRVAPHVRQA